jgi:hypothetical protein
MTIFKRIKTFGVVTQMGNSKRTELRDSTTDDVYRFVGKHPIIIMMVL